jgi:hypothetical protein
MSSLRPPISHTTVVAYLALFAALGGTTYAAATLTGRDIENGTITGADIHNNSVRSADVKGVTGADLRPGAPWSLRSPNGRFAIVVNNSGVKMDGPVGDVAVDKSLKSENRVRISATGPVQIDGSTVELNGSCASVANGDTLSTHIHNAPSGGGATSPPLGGPFSFLRVRAC